MKKKETSTQEEDGWVYLEEVEITVGKDQSDQWVIVSAWSAEKTPGEGRHRRTIWLHPNEVYEEEDIVVSGYRGPLRIKRSLAEKEHLQFFEPTEWFARKAAEATWSFLGEALWRAYTGVWEFVFKRFAP